MRSFTILTAAATAMTMLAASPVLASGTTEDPTHYQRPDDHAYAAHRAAVDELVAQQPSRRSTITASDADRYALPFTGQATFAQDDACAQDDTGDAVDSPRLDIAAYGVIQFCDDPSIGLVTITYDSWSETELDVFAVPIGTDDNISTGCDGADYLALGFYDAAEGLVAGLLRTPSCDSEEVVSLLEIGRGAADGIVMLVEPDMVGNPSRVETYTGLKSLYSSTLDFAPETGVVAISPAASTSAPAPTPVSSTVRSTTRLAGASRHATSVAISKYQFPGGAQKVFLSRDDNFADSISGASLTGGPVLLVPSCGPVPAEVLAEVRRLGATEIIALGGSGAICDQVLDQVARA